MSLSAILSIVSYYFLKNRHKAILKTQILHTLSLVDNTWNIKPAQNQFLMLSPTMLIDGIYKSMEGPKVSNLIQFNNKNELFWVTGFKVEALNNINEIISNDFVCHMNVDFNDFQYYTQLKLPHRIGKQYPRLTSLSHGLESFQFPEGFGVPMFGNSKLQITSQTLNHNISKINMLVKHRIKILHQQKKLLPLQSKTVFLQLPFNENNPYKEPLDPASNQCIPVETKNHTYLNSAGKKLSGHWVIFPGTKKYKSNINDHLVLKDSLRLHFAAPHVHPFATSISMFDATTNTTLFTCKIKNANNKISLKKINTFSSIKGIWLYNNHNYEIHLETNNTTKINQDMMASLFLFFYDNDLQKKLN